MYEAEKSKELPKFDRRLSGSTEIDNVLHDVSYSIPFTIYFNKYN